MVTVLPVGVRFECDEDEPILHAAIRAGLLLPYGCRKGNCGTCKAQILEGEADLETESSYSISSFEAEMGFTLLCSAYAVSDLTVEMEGLDLEDIESGIPPRLLTGRIVDIAEHTTDIRGLTIELDEPMEFRAGQFAELNLPDSEVWRSYSMANPPSRPDRAEFMIKLVPDGAFSGALNHCSIAQPIRLRAPHGSFWVREHDRPLLLVGGGAGMAPLWSILQNLAETGDRRPVRFFYGARTPADLFHLAQIAATGRRLEDFEFVAALSHTNETDAGQWELGMVPDVVERILGTDISDFDAYLCGPPPMIDAALSMLENHKLEEHRSIFYDKFSPS